MFITHKLGEASKLKVFKPEQVESGWNWRLDEVSE